MIHQNPEHFVIAQFSDLHCGGPRFDEHLLERVVREINEAEPDLVVVPGDLTADGYRDEYEVAKGHLEQIECKDVIVIPGNHDSRNVGYLHFVELFGQRWDVREMNLDIASDGEGTKHVRVVSVDSTKPDLNDGEVGRHRYQWLGEKLGHADEDVFKVVVIHHHLVGIPNTGRERNIVLDAGDVIEMLATHDVDLVLAGHKHVPYVWPVGGMLVCTSGTACTWRTRANIPPSYNLVTIARDTILVDIIDSNGEGSRRLEFDTRKCLHVRGGGRLEMIHNHGGGSPLD
jgi:Icc protein